MKATLTLDYTPVAEPVSVGDVKFDVDACWCNDMEPHKVILWQHQLDWMVKEVGGRELVAGTLAKGEHIWGIPLEVRQS